MAKSTLTCLPAIIGVFATLAVPLPAAAQLVDLANGCAYEASTTCETLSRPLAPLPPLGVSAYTQVGDRAFNRYGVDIGRHGSFSPDYVNNRAADYCAMLADGNFTRMMQMVSFSDAGGLFEDADGKPQLEMSILHVAALNVCPMYWAEQQGFEAQMGG